VGVRWVGNFQTTIPAQQKLLKKTIVQGETRQKKSKASAFCKPGLEKKNLAQKPSPTKIKNKSCRT